MQREARQSVICARVQRQPRERVVAFENASVRREAVTGLSVLLSRVQTLERQSLNWNLKSDSRDCSSARGRRCFVGQTECG